MKNSILLGAGIISSVLLFNQSAKAAEDYLGADAVLKKVAAAGGEAAAPAEDAPELAKLKADFKSFKDKSATMKPEEAAKTWLDLLDQQTKLPSTAWRGQLGRAKSENTFGPQDIWKALPPPSAWEALRKAIEARPTAKGKDAAREAGLKFFAHTLTADAAAQRRDVVELEAVFGKANEEEGYRLAQVLDTIADKMMENSTDAEATLRTLERRLARESSGGYSGQMYLPDLVTLVGPVKAEAFIRKALAKPSISLEAHQGEATQKLARKLALEMIDQLKTPQWDLACSLDGVALYEALEKKFVSKDEATNNAAASPDDAPLVDHMRQLNRSGGEQQQAQTYYLLGLIVAGRTSEAVALAQKLGRGDRVYLPEEALKSLDRAGHTRALHNFFFELLSKNPDLPFWDQYIQLAARVGETGKMLELARAAATRDDVTDERRSVIRQNLLAALLAADQVDEAIKEIREMLANKEVKVSTRFGYGNSGYSRGSTAYRLAKLGQLLARPELTEEGLRVLREALVEKKPDDYESSNLRLGLAALLAELNRGSEAEACLIEALVAEQKKPVAEYGNRKSTYPYLIKLAELYHKAGRPADVIFLLEKSPDWQMKDLAGIYAQAGYSYGHDIEDPMGLNISHIAADSLLAVGRKDEARKIVNTLLEHNGGFDPAYELVIKIGGDDVMGRLDATFANDPFEERPLIWKAELLRKAGKLEEAEKVVRRAIAIDPSDGEQGPGRRMRAYAVLADIRAARGDQKQADFFRGAVDAIRLSEKADRYYAAGLLKQAVKMYEDSLTHFADAYCIQSRLALRLSEMGLNEQAEEHYRRAYELMPDSFGRVESHCFGCERAFDGERAQGIAEKVFSDLAKSTPEKPQVHYLLGYLREEQERYPEALASYRQAVKLDPDYLNAWKHVGTVAAHDHVPAADRDAVVFNLLRLDPLGIHGSEADFKDVVDLRGLWTACEVAAKKQPAKVEALFALAASKQKLEKEEADKKANPGAGNGYYRSTYYTSDYFGRRGGVQPAEAILQTSMISAVSPLLGVDSRYGGEFGWEE